MTVTPTTMRNICSTRSLARYHCTGLMMNERENKLPPPVATMDRTAAAIVDFLRALLDNQLPVANFIVVCFGGAKCYSFATEAPIITNMRCRGSSGARFTLEFNLFRESTHRTSFVLLHQPRWLGFLLYYLVSLPPRRMNYRSKRVQVEFNGVAAAASAAFISCFNIAECADSQGQAVQDQPLSSYAAYKSHVTIAVFASPSRPYRF